MALDKLQFLHMYAEAFKYYKSHRQSTGLYLTHRVGCVDIHSWVQVLYHLLLLSSASRTEEGGVWVGLQYKKQVFAVGGLQKAASDGR